MNIMNFTHEHIEQATVLVKANYEEEKQVVPILPIVDIFPDLTQFAENGLGVSAFENGEMLGFLCCYNPWDNAFKTNTKGTFTPIHAHGAVYKDREKIYKKLYQAAAEKWIENGIYSHAVGIYANDTQAISSFYTNGFGLRCVDAIRPMLEIECPRCNHFNYLELDKSNVSVVTPLRQMLSLHLGNSPCFMHSTPKEDEEWLIRAKKRDSRIFIASQDKTIVAFIEATSSGENFVTENADMLNICGAFCLPENRGQGINQSILNYMITTFKNEGYNRLGVDFESFNPTAYGFWLKYFTAYTHSVVRRVDGWIMEANA